MEEKNITHKDIKQLFILTGLILILLLANSLINNSTINKINTKLDNLHTTDTIYIDVDDMNQVEWKPVMSDSL